MKNKVTTDDCPKTTRDPVHIAYHRTKCDTNGLAGPKSYRLVLSRSLWSGVDRQGLLGRRIFVQRGNWSRLHLADNVADVVVVPQAEASRVRMPMTEVLRVLRPGGMALVGAQRVVKPFPEGAGDWSHPYHGPDNNPQSTDTLARAPYLTHFLAEPWYSPMPLVTVASGGRLFKAFGHIAIKQREWPLLNTLVAQNAFNGTILWQRELSPNFMIHRSTMIATPDTLYLADDVSCKLLDAATGDIRGQIVVGPEDGPCGNGWRWPMGCCTRWSAATRRPIPPSAATAAPAAGPGGRRWAPATTARPIPGVSVRRFWPSIRLRKDSVAASRDGSDRHPGDVHGGGSDLLLQPRQVPRSLERGRRHGAVAHLGPRRAAGHRRASVCPESRRRILVVVVRQVRRRGESTSPVRLAPTWRRFPPATAACCGGSPAPATANWCSAPMDLIAMGPRGSAKYDYASGEVIEHLGPRVNCTRATGSVDSIFVRGGRDGTMRYDLLQGTRQHISPMRPSCQDGVLIAHGHLYWGRGCATAT
jgi:hypothetical protein